MALQEHREDRRPAQRLRAWRADAAGNRFLLVDLLDRGPAFDDQADDWARLALEICRKSANEFSPDGLLLAAPAAAGSAAVGRMVLFNRDGSRPEACGNGLRVIALHLARVLGRDGALLIGTDSGLRQASVVRGGSSVEVCLGPSRITREGLTLEIPGFGSVTGTAVDVGNPHFVINDKDPGAVDLQRLGPAIERHAAFRARTNVEVADLLGRPIRARVWERGVGETGACGTGAAAVACVAGLARPEKALTVMLPGGPLEIRKSAGEVWLAGPTMIEEQPLETGREVDLLRQL